MKILPENSKKKIRYYMHMHMHVHLRLYKFEEMIPKNNAKIQCKQKIKKKNIK